MSRYFACCGYRHLYELDSYLMSCEERPKVKVFASWMGKIWIWMLLKENWLCKSQTNNRPITIGEAQKSKSELITAGGIDQDISLKLIWKILLFNNELIKIFRLFFAIPDKKWVSHQTGKVRRPIRIAKMDRHTSKSWKKNCEVVSLQLLLQGSSYKQKLNNNCDVVSLQLLQQGSPYKQKLKQQLQCCFTGSFDERAFVMSLFHTCEAKH